MACHRRLVAVGRQGASIAGTGAAIRAGPSEPEAIVSLFMLARSRVLGAVSRDCQSGGGCG